MVLCCRPYVFEYNHLVILIKYVIGCLYLSLSLNLTEFADVADVLFCILEIIFDMGFEPPTDESSCEEEAYGYKC